MERSNITFRFKTMKTRTKVIFLTLYPIVTTKISCYKIALTPHHADRFESVENWIQPGKHSLGRIQWRRRRKKEEVIEREKERLKKKRRGNGKKQKLGTPTAALSPNEKLDKCKREEMVSKSKESLSFSPCVYSFYFLLALLDSNISNLAYSPFYIYFIIFHRISSDIGVDEEHPTCPLTRHSNRYISTAWLKNSLHRSRLTDQSVL